MPGYHDPVQHHRRLSCLSLDTIQEYFAQLNPIAKRIAYDINDTKANYGQLWDTLNYNEQNDIINDTLIKPEISLHYFDNFLTPTPTNSSGNSYQSSMDSLTAIVLKDVSKKHEDSDAKNKQHKRSIKQYEGLKSIGTEGTKSYYSYDGRNLHTFGIQKVALKVVQDEALGCFRDEYSRPFCYRTKSQINLFVLQHANMDSSNPIKVKNNSGAAAYLKSSSAAPNANNLPKPDDEETKKALDNYHRLQQQLKINLSDNFHKSHEILKIKSIKPSSITGQRKLIKSPDLVQKDKGNINTKKSLLQNYLQSTQLNSTPKIDVNYAVYTDAYNMSEESSNLLQHCGRNDLATASCSSAATSDDDEKTLEAEDVHLLDNDSNIRKGFDFLNNW